MCITLFFFYLADFKYKSNTKKQIYLSDRQYELLNETTPFSEANSSAFTTDNSAIIEEIEETPMDESINEKLVELFKTPTDFNWAWQF